MDNWDLDNTLWELLALSRLIQTNPISTIYAVRIVRDPEGTRIVPLAEDSKNRYNAFIYDPSGRYWLDTADAQALAALWANYRGSRLPERLSNALYWSESAARSRDLGVRWTFASIAVEALLNTGEGTVTRQIAQRLPDLARDVGIVDMTESMARDFYRRRSAIVHGDRPAFIRAEPDAQDLDRVERIVRATLRRGIGEPEFGQVFEADSTIRSRWARY